MKTFNELREKYLRADHLCCPLCDAIELEKAFIFQDNEGNAYRQISCKICGLKWTEYFTFDNVTFGGEKHEKK